MPPGKNKFKVLIRWREWNKAAPHILSAVIHDIYYSCEGQLTDTPYYPHSSVQIP